MTGVAVVGTGAWAPRLAAAAGRAGLAVVTCFARDAQHREAFASAWGCRAAASFEEAISDPAVEGVLLATPNDVHCAQALACAERGRHVFVEKPIADTAEAGVAMREACAAAGVVLMVGHAFRRLGAARRAGELIAGGRLGRVVLAEANFSLPGRLVAGAWRAERARNPGGPLLQLGIHHVDTLTAWLGPIARSTGVLGRVHTPADVDDVGVLTLEFASGAIGVVTGSYVSPHTFSLRVLGTEAVLELRAELAGVWPEAERVDSVTTLRVDGAPVGFEPRDMLAEELAEFAAAIRGEAVVETGADEGLSALRAVLGAVEPVPA